MLITAIIIFATFSVTASFLTVAALMLSSRISQSENLVEVYEYVEEPPQLVPSNYSLHS
jgi:hypothetical protein